MKIPAWFRVTSVRLKIQFSLAAYMSPSACLHCTTPHVHWISSAIFQEFWTSPSRLARQFYLDSSALYMYVLFQCCLRTLYTGCLGSAALHELMSCRVYVHVQAAWCNLHSQGTWSAVFVFCLSFAWTLVYDMNICYIIIYFTFRSCCRLHRGCAVTWSNATQRITAFSITFKVIYFRPGPS